MTGARGMAGPGKAHCTVTQAIALFLAAVLLHQVLKDRVPPFQSQTHAVVPEPLTSPDGAAPAGPGAARDAAGGGPTNRPAPQSEAGGEAGPSAPRARADGERKRASDAPGGDAAAAPGARGPPATDDARPRARARDGGRAAEEAGAPWTPPDSSTFYRVIREGGPAERRRLLRRLEGPTSPPLTVAVSMCDYSWIEFCENMAYHHRQHLPRTPLLMHVMDRRAMEWCAGRLSKRMRVVCVYPPMSTAHKKRGCRSLPRGTGRGGVARSGGTIHKSGGGGGGGLGAPPMSWAPSAGPLYKSFVRLRCACGESPGHSVWTAGRGEGPLPPGGRGVSISFRM